MANPRDTHFFSPGPKRILALDGGGTLGIVELAFLERIEALLRAAHGGDPAFRLSQWFDLIGGTSTGAIIASCLALGMPVAAITRAYLQLAPRAFHRKFWRLPGLAPRFAARPLERFLFAMFGDRTLDSDDLLTGLAMVARRFDTGSPWLISNNPHAHYWKDPADRAYIGNRHYRLADMVRASTAAPGFFRPQRLQIVEGEPPGLFIDGALSPYNNPSLQLLLLTQARAFGLQWKMDPENLLLISIGAGQFRHRLAKGKRAPITAGGLGLHSLMDTVADGNLLTLTLLQWFGEPPMSWPINSEIGDLSGEVLGGRPLLKFQRYDMPLEMDWLQKELAIGVSAKKVTDWRRIDNPNVMPELYELAARTAENQVRLSHLS